MVQEYVGEPFQAFGIEVWNGALGFVQAYENTTGVTYPTLRMGASVGTAYATPRDVSFVLDGDGVITYRNGGFNGTAVRAAVDAALAALTTGIETPRRPGSFRLHPARPNPFNPATTIGWTLDEGLIDAHVKIEIHDMRGRRLASLADGRYLGGRDHEIVWQGRDDAGASVNSGTYIVVLDVDGAQQARFLTLVK